MVWLVFFELDKVKVCVLFGVLIYDIFIFFNKLVVMLKMYFDVLVLCLGKNVVDVCSLFG